MDEEDHVDPEQDPDRFIRVGGLVDETNVTLAIYGDHVDPDEIAAALRCDPTDSHRRGDSRGNPRHAPYSTGAWMLSVRGKAPRSPADLVQAVLSRVPDDERIWSELSDRFDVQMRFGIVQNAWNRGFDLPSELVAQLSRVQATLVFDIYASDEDESDDQDD